MLTGRALTIVISGLFVSLAMRTAPPAFATDGQAIAANGKERGAPACTACHGAQGEGQPEAGYPRLSGLNAEYLLHQLNDFADGRRENEIMHPIAEALSPEERQAVASFFAASAAPQAPEPARPDEKVLASGAALALRGDWTKGLPGCVQCHGPGGQGVGVSFPKLAGQSAAYIAGQLKAGQEGKRANGPLNLMTGVAAKLDDSQIAAVAAYYSGLPSTDPEPERHEGTKQ